MELSIAQIRTDGGTQPRAELDQAIIDEYGQAIHDGAEFPPVIVFYDGTDYWLADGFHRLYAATHAGRKSTIAADVRQGTRRDAVLFSVGANASHGLRRTNADKRRSVETLLRDEEWRGWSDREIARRCAVANSFVSGLRGSLFSENSGDRIYTTRHGTTATMNTANIGSTPRGENLATEIVQPVEAPAVRPLAEVFTAAEAQPEPARPTTLAEAFASSTPDLSDQDDWKLGDEQRIDDVRVMCADARTMDELIDDGSVDLVITSPPYNVNIDYASHDDNLSDDAYADLLGTVFARCYEVLTYGGRIAVVVPFGVGRNPWRPVAARVAGLLDVNGFTLRGQIVWDKGTSGNRTSWGSWRLPTDPSLRDTTECIVVAQKGPSRLDVPAGVLDAEGFSPWLSGDEFMALASDHWTIAPESAQRIGHPAPFPVPLVERLMRFYAYPGAHVLDPFAGSGTVAVAALRLGCRASLVEIDPAYCGLATERCVKALVEGKNGQ